MAIRFRVLGGAGRDNALFVEIDSGQGIGRLLFDCGEGCLNELSQAEVQSIDHLFFSHFHMDHVSGFDSFFRANFDRESRDNHLWGPPGSATILHHRFQSYLWNLHENLSAVWRVSDIEETEVSTWRFVLTEAFGVAHEELASARADRLILETEDFEVSAMAMDHGTPSMAYRVTEKTRWNVDPVRLAAMGLKPGPWLKRLKDRNEIADNEVIGGHRAGDLREELVVATPGESIAYLTDFLMDEGWIERLADWLVGCDTLVCESQYRAADIELARKNFHMTSTQGAALANRIGAKDLVLFHVSGRYSREELRELLEEARQVFPRARFSDAWGVEAME